MTQFCISELAPRGQTPKRGVTCADAEEPAQRGPEDDRGAGRRARSSTRANRAIIEALQRDGRCPYGTIAQQVGLSEAAVRRRVQRLRETGIMEIVAVTDPRQLGFNRQALIGITRGG